MITDALGKAARGSRCVAFARAERIKRQLGIDSLPPHVQGFGAFMVTMAARKIGPRDVVKAYTLTRSSIQRSAVPCVTLRRKGWPEAPCHEGERVRPEDVFAKLLQTPTGRRYLDAAERGDFDADAAEWLTSRMRPFGTTPTLRADLRRAAELAAKAEDVNRLVRGHAAEWSAFAQQHFWGIAHSKTGFVSALLGRGDIPTADAREIKLWTKRRVLPVVDAAGQPVLDARGKPKVRTLKTKVTGAFVARLSSRLADLNLQTPPELRPFYQHLAHHAVWDAMGGTQTTHADQQQCMLFAGLGRAAGRRRQGPRYTQAHAIEAARRARIKLDRCITAKSLAEGMNVEREHRDVTKGSATTTAKIAAAHLRERCDYYEVLRQVERKGRR